MTIQSWGEAIGFAFQSSWEKIIGYLPNLVGALLVFILGLIVAWLVKWLLVQFFTVIQINKLADRIKLTEILKKMKTQTDFAQIIGIFFYWLIIIIFLLPVFSILGLTEINLVLYQVLAYVPNVLVAGFMILVGVLVAEAVGNLIKAAAVSFGSGAAGFLASLARYAIIIFVSLAALSQLGVATYFLQTLFTAFVAFIAIAGGLAFGLGGKDSAKDFIEKLREDFKMKK